MECSVKVEYWLNSHSLPPAEFGPAVKDQHDKDATARPPPLHATQILWFRFRKPASK